MDLQLTGRVALVVASSRGLGKAIAGQLSQEGCDVMLTGRDVEQLERTRLELQEVATGRVDCHPCDITWPDDIEELVCLTHKRLGAIDILINNAGGPPGGGFDQLDDSAWQAAFELNLLSCVRMIRAALPDLKSTGGRIINVTSSSVKQPIPGLLLSNVFRMGLLSLGKSLADELAPYGILVNTVAPGRVATDRTVYLDQLKADRAGVPMEQIAEEARGRIPLKRYGDPQEFARVVAFLASGVNTYMTGSVVMVDGGMVRSY